MREKFTYRWSVLAGAVILWMLIMSNSLLNLFSSDGSQSLQGIVNREITGILDTTSASVNVNANRSPAAGYDCVRLDQTTTNPHNNNEPLRVLVTGGAGFVGMHVSLELKNRGHTVVSYDNMIGYYPVELKHRRVTKLHEADIIHVEGDVCDAKLLKKTLVEHKIDRIIHLAAQAGVRNSILYPHSYIRNNVDCFITLLETMVELNLHVDANHLVYASSSSVYGNNIHFPFSESDPVDNHASLYASTKRSDELIARTYHNLYNLSSVGLRFFTVYGGWGRPDMAYYIFTDLITRNQTVKVFNHGKSLRDFTYIDDIVEGVVGSLYAHWKSGAEVLNLGGHHPVELMTFLNTTQQMVGVKEMRMELVEMQKGDVPVTYANIDKARCLLGWEPTVGIEEGLRRFSEWFVQEDGGQYRIVDATKEQK